MNKKKIELIIFKRLNWIVITFQTTKTSIQAYPLGSYDVINRSIDKFVSEVKN